MNINLSSSGDYPQGDIDEHIEIMRNSGAELTGRVMLLPDPEYPNSGAYRVWTERAPKKEFGIRNRGQEPTWLWVTPDGEVIYTQRPWAVTG